MAFFLTKTYYISITLKSFHHLHNNKYKLAYKYYLKFSSIFLNIMHHNQLFCECSSHCRFQPYDYCIIIHPLHGVDSVHLQILLTGTCRQCGSWSVAGHNHRKVTGRDSICASQHDMGQLTCPEAVHQRPCMTREIETWLSDSRVSNNNVVDHRSRRPVLSQHNCVDRDRGNI